MNKKTTDLKQEILDELAVTGPTSINEFVDRMEKSKGYSQTAIYKAIREMNRIGALEKNETSFYNHMIIKHPDVKNDIEAINKLMDARFGGSFCFMISFYLKRHGLNEDERKELAEVFFTDGFSDIFCASINRST